MLRNLGARLSLAEVEAWGPEELAAWLGREKLLSRFQPMALDGSITIGALLDAVVAGEGDWEDFGVLLTLQVVNGTVGFFEEKSAGDAIAALKDSHDVAFTHRRARRPFDAGVRDAYLDLADDDSVAAALWSDPQGASRSHAPSSATSAGVGRQRASGSRASSDSAAGPTSRTRRAASASTSETCAGRSAHSDTSTSSTVRYASA